MDKINKQIKNIEKHLGKNNIYLYVISITLFNNLGEKINCIKIGHTTRNLLQRFIEIFNKFNLINMNISFLLNIDNPYIYERKFHARYKQFRLKNINSSVFTKSIECYPDNEKIIECMYNFFILELNKFVKKNNYYMEPNFIKKINTYISKISEINTTLYVKQIYDKKILEPYDLPINILQKLNVEDNIAIYFEDINEWHKGHIVQVNKRKIRKENVSIEIRFSKNNVLRYNILANNENYGRDKIWVLPIY